MAKEGLVPIEEGNELTINKYTYESKILTLNPSIHPLRLIVNSKEFSQLLPNWPDSSTGGALHRYRRGQGLANLDFTFLDS